MIFVDTGFLLAFAQPADGLHERAKAWASAITEPLLVTEYVLWETVNGLSKPPMTMKFSWTAFNVLMSFWKVSKSMASVKSWISAIASTMSCTRSSHALGDMDRLRQDLRSDARLQTVGRSQVDGTTKQVL